MKSIWIPPMFTTLRVNTLKIGREAAKHQLQSYLNSKTCSRHFKVCVFNHLPDVLYIEFIRNLDVEICTDHVVIVDKLCGAAVLRGADIFVPGIVAMSAVDCNSEVAVYIDLDGKITKGAQPNLSQSTFLFIGNGISVYSRNDIFKFKTVTSGVGIEMTQCIFRSPRLNKVLPSFIVLQNFPSIVVSHCLCPQPGEKVIDLCASPGGKTSHIATLMQNIGSVTAIDKSISKINAIENLCKLLDIDIVETLVMDSSKDSIFKMFAEDSFDRVLTDVPCSALGQRPRFSNECPSADYQKFQRKFIYNAIKLLKPGGIFVYSTCTTEFAENEEQVSWVLSKFPCMTLDKPFVLYGDSGRPCNGLQDDDLQKLQYFPPIPRGHSPDLDTIGFFIAVFKKN